jgi:hypothetical protein
MIIQFRISDTKGVHGVVVVSEATDRDCTDSRGHNFSPEAGARSGIHGAECAYCSHYQGIEAFESLSEAICYATDNGLGSQISRSEQPEPGMIQLHLTRRFELSVDSGESCIIRASGMQDAREQAEDWASDGEYEERVAVEVTIREIGGEGETEWLQVEAGPLPEPPESDCGTGDEDHDWTNRHELVGGCEENPGVWSMGGTRMLSQHVCSRCGIRKTETHAGEQRNPGELARVVEYSLPETAEVEAE